VCSAPDAGGSPRKSGSPLAIRGVIAGIAGIAPHRRKRKSHHGDTEARRKVKKYQKVRGGHVFAPTLMKRADSVLPEPSDLNRFQRGNHQHLAGEISSTS